MDNAKFLGAAEQYIHPIYLEDPIMMKAPLMRLLYTVKMIFNVSTYFNNSVRVSSLLVKITNQIIISCKRYITAGGRVTIWNQERLVRLFSTFPLYFGFTGRLWRKSYMSVLISMHSTSG